METVNAQLDGREVEDLGELLRGAGDDRGIEAEEQAAERADDDAPDEQCVEVGFTGCGRLSLGMIACRSDLLAPHGQLVAVGVGEVEALPPGNSKVSRTILPPAAFTLL